MTPPGPGRRTTELRQGIQRWAREFDARDLLMLGLVSILFGIVLLVGPLRSVGIVTLAANFLVMTGTMAVIFGIPWYVVDRLVS